MAKRYTIGELSGISSREFSKMNKSELQGRLESMSKIIDRRIEGFSSYKKGKGISQSPALRAYRNGGADKLSYSDKLSLEEMRDEYVRGLNLLKAETGTATGWDKVRGRIIRGLQNEGIAINRANFDEFFDKYSKLKEANPSFGLKENKYEAMRKAIKVVQGIDEIVGNRASEDTEDTGKDDEKKEGKSKGGYIQDLIDEMASSLSLQGDEEFSSMFKLTKDKKKQIRNKRREESRKQPLRETKHRSKGISDVVSGTVDIDIEVDDIL